MTVFSEHDRGHMNSKIQDTYELTAAVTLSTRPTQDQASWNPRAGVRGACKVVPQAEEPLAVAG